MSVDESGMRRPRADAQRASAAASSVARAAQKEHGRASRRSRKGIVKYAKPGRVIAGMIPVTSPYVTPGRHRDLRDQVQGRGGLLAASREPQYDDRDRSASCARR
jgi:hypothetical protein